MSVFCKLSYLTCRLLFKQQARHQIGLLSRNFLLNSYSSNFDKIFLNMSQRSITSFFTKTPKKSIDADEADNKHEEDVEEKLEKSHKYKKLSSDTESLSEKKTVKRQRLNSSSSESNSPKKIVPPPKSSEKKKKVKRQRIESSSSEATVSPASSPVKKSKETTPVKAKPKKASPVKTPVKTEPKEDSPASSPDIKPEEASPVKFVKKEPASSVKTYASPKNKKTKASTVKKPLSEQNGKVKKEEESPKQKEDKNSDKKSEKDSKDLVSETAYDPSKSKYHPIEDACWKPGQPVPYLALARTFELIEGTSARLKIIDILSNYYRSVIALTPEDLLPSVYMCLNQLAPAYHNLELGIADTYLLKAIAAASGNTLSQMKAAVARAGDLGLAAEKARRQQSTLMRPSPLVLRKVFATLKEVASMSGQSSVNKKISKIQTLYVACRNSEARYLIRSLAGKLRIGLAEQSVLQALSCAVAATPPGGNQLDVREDMNPEQYKKHVEETSLTIKSTYCMCPNYDIVIPAILSAGVDRLTERCPMAPGVPVKPMLAHPTRGVSEVLQRFEGLEFTCEYKYDGERAQIHIPDGPDLKGASIFSRNQENNTSKYPDILSRLPSLLKSSVKSCVLDCEAVAYDAEHDKILPFQILSTRKRKDAVEADIKVRVCVFVFDLLYLNGKPLVGNTLAERRALLWEHFNEEKGSWQFATHQDCSSLDEMQQLLEQSVRDSCEGLMVKTLRGKDATYEIAKRSRNWLKLKKDYLEGVGDTLDVVVLGGYLGRGKRTGAYGGFLLACYDPRTEEYQSLCKIGTGFSDEDLQTLSAGLKEHVIDGPRNYYRYDKSHTPDDWFSAAAVWEIRCADLSLSPHHCAAQGTVDSERGISLRFPRFVRVREDKSPEQATSAQQVAEMYLSQDQVKNQIKTSVEDDFY